MEKAKKIFSDYRPIRLRLQMYLLHRFKSNDLIYKENAINKLYPSLIQVRLNTVVLKSI